MVGRGGHMSDTAVAGFDPIFFLHHSNVDRLLSLWAAVNPEVWVSEGPAEGGSYTISGSSSVDTNTALTPFWKTQTACWDSSQTTGTGDLNYSYPEFNNLDMGDPDAVKTAIGNYINQQYGGGVLSLVRGGAPLSRFAQSPAAGGAQATQGQGELPTTAAENDKEGPKFYDWTVRIHFKKYEVGGSFAVLIFLGEVPEDPSQWHAASTFVGAHYAFVNGAASQCDNCRKQADLVVEGFVHLSSTIAERSGLSSFDPTVVVPYLKENLQWRVQAVDRTEVDLSRLPSLEVTVVSTPLTQAPGAIFPIPGDQQYHHHITHGRPGGARHA